MGADDDGVDGGDGAGAGDGAPDVLEQPQDPGTEVPLLTGLHAVGLHHPDAAQGLGEATGHLSVDLAALPKYRSQGGEGVGHGGAERKQEDQDGEGELPVQIEQHADRQQRGQGAPHELDDAGTDQVADPLGVGHDPRNEHPALGVVEVAGRQPRDLLLNAFAHLHDGLLGSHTHHLSHRKRGARLEQGRDPHGDRQGPKQLPLAQGQHIIDQELRARRQHETEQTPHDHQPEADGQAAPVLPEQAPSLGPNSRTRSVSLACTHGRVPLIRLQEYQAATVGLPTWPTEKKSSKIRISRFGAPSDPYASLRVLTGSFRDHRRGALKGIQLYSYQSFP